MDGEQNITKSVDADAELVDRARTGDLTAFG
jgi:hypothetical protein